MMKIMILLSPIFATLLPIAKLGQSKTDSFSIPSCEDAKLFKPSAYFSDVEIPQGSDALLEVAALYYNESTPVVVKSYLGNTITNSAFERQLSLMNRLNQPPFQDIAPYFYGAYKDDLYVHFVMEYIKGKDLSELMANENKSLSNKRATEIIVPILSMVKKLHDLKIIHRDLKLENIMYADNKFLLIDFEHAIDLKEYIGFEASHSIGTEIYRSPELHENKIYDEKVDIYPIGILFLELVLGKRAPQNLSMESLDDLTRDFVQKMVSMTPETRWSAEALLNHPFIHQNADLRGKRFTKARRRRMRRDAKA